MPTVLSTTTPKARKRHICDSCCKPILPGTVYERQFCADGGGAWSYVAHRPCIAAAQILWDNYIRGDEDALINVSDMDREDREMVYRSSPEIYRAVWPDAPPPGSPEIVTT